MSANQIHCGITFDGVRKWENFPNTFHIEKIPWMPLEDADKHRLNESQFNYEISSSTIVTIKSLY